MKREVELIDLKIKIVEDGLEADVEINGLAVTCLSEVNGINKEKLTAQIKTECELFAEKIGAILYE